MFRCVCAFAAFLLLMSPVLLRAEDEGPRLWEADKLTATQPFPGKVRAVESSWGGYQLLLESSGEGEKRYCMARAWPGGYPHLEYREIKKTDLPKPGVTIVYLEPSIEVSRFSWSMGPWRIGRIFGDEDCLKKAATMQATSGRGNETGLFIGLSGESDPVPLISFPESTEIIPFGGLEIDPVKQKKLYDHYTGNKFADIAHELARELGDNPDLVTGCVPAGMDETPWSYNLAYTLRNAWEFHTRMTPEKPTDRSKFDVLMSVLEDGKVGLGRGWALLEIHSFLEHQGWAGDGSLPPADETMRRLHVIAANEEEKDSDLRQQLVTLIFKYGDSNEVLDLAIELASREEDPRKIASAFYDATPSEGAKRLTKANRAKLLKHGFVLLGRINDGKSGSGNYLACHLGWVIGIEPVREGQSPFEPDQRLPEYRVNGGLTEAYFQKPVDEAMEWWEKHRAEYE